MSLAKPITPHLWFSQEAREAAEFYCAAFPDTKITHHGRVRNTPSGDCDIVSSSVGAQPFMAISAGPVFTFNPAISFVVNFDPTYDAKAGERLDMLWSALKQGGKVLMPLDEYPFSKYYGWVQDRYGLSWQLILSDAQGEPRPFITPALMFTGAAYGKAEEAGAFYRSVFDNSCAGQLIRFTAGMAPEREGAVMFSDFRLGDTWFAALDSAHNHGFGFSEAVSFVVHCRNQAEIDRYWSALSAVPEAEQCGWCKDKFGVSWQIIPAALDEMMRSGNQARIDRITQTFLKMKKFDVALLQAAYAGGD